MKISFKNIGGATWILDIGDYKIACDPVLCPKGSVQDYRAFESERVEAPVFTAEDFARIDLWLLTHGHEDHCDEAGAAMIRGGKVLAHPSLFPRWEGLKVRNEVKVLKRNGEATFAAPGIQVTVKALPMVHGRNRLFGRLVGQGNGYLIAIARAGEYGFIYATGDTVHRKWIARALGGLEPGLIIANAGGARVGKSLLAKILGRITNDSRDLRKLSRDFPKARIIPVHHGTFSHYEDKLDTEALGPRFIAPRPGEEIEFEIES